MYRWSSPGIGSIHRLACRWKYGFRTRNCLSTMCWMLWNTSHQSHRKRGRFYVILAFLVSWQMNIEGGMYTELPCALFEISAVLWSPGHKKLGRDSSTSESPNSGVIWMKLTILMKKILFCIKFTTFTFAVVGYYCNSFWVCCSCDHFLGPGCMLWFFQ